MKIPNSVRIGHYDYKVVHDEETEKRMIHQHLDGEVDYTNKEIYLRDVGSKQYMEGVFIHEVTHALLFESGFRTEAMDEKTVDMLANNLYGLLINNNCLLEPQE